MNEKFMRLFLNSLPLTKAGLLKISLVKLRAATLTAGDRGWRALGKANEAILLGHHFGDGLAAYEAAKESLVDIREFQAASAEFAEMTQLTVFEDILNMVPGWSESYEECIRLNHIRAEFLPSQESNDKLQEIIDLNNQEPEWWRTQLGLAYNFYHCDRPEPDRSLIAQGMSVLQCLLRRALDESPGYNLTADQIEAVLLDYIFIGYKQFEVLRDRYQAKWGAGNYLPKDDILAVANNILDIWLEVASKLPTWKKENRKEGEKTLGYYWIFFDSFSAKEVLLPLTKYFKKAMMVCKKCGQPIPKVATTCRNCLIQFNVEAFSQLEEVCREASQETLSSTSDRNLQKMYDPFIGWDDQSSGLEESFLPDQPKSLANRIFNWLVLLGCLAVFFYFVKTDYYAKIFQEYSEIGYLNIGSLLMGVLVPLLGLNLLIDEIMELLAFWDKRKFK
ncbi:MAG: hypothetical protein LBS44_07025 [Deltaproteobacteria bacterium]|jgi:hypothetical protein|nr:hypothetical protein [Deltaproteobacteria bacterium]